MLRNELVACGVGLGLGLAIPHGHPHKTLHSAAGGGEQRSPCPVPDDPNPILILILSLTRWWRRETRPRRACSSPHSETTGRGCVFTVTLTLPMSLSRTRTEPNPYLRNRSQMHQEADQTCAPDLFSTYAATSNLGVHANP